MPDISLQKQYKTFCKIQNLKNIRQFVESTLVQAMPAKDLHLIVLAVDEVCSNSMVHGNSENPEKTVEIFLYLQKNMLKVEVCDTGLFYNVAQYHEPTLQSLIDKKHKGGLGMMLVNRVMDKVESVSHNGKNIYRMLKKVDQM